MMRLFPRLLRGAFFFILACLFFFIPKAANAAGSAWLITKDHWSPRDEQNYSAFVQALGESGCNRVDRCMKSPVNPYRASDPGDYRISSDCAKFPYLLRAYFAWKNGLPFSYESGVSSNDGSRDIRYSPHGNRVTHRREITQPSDGRTINGFHAVHLVISEVDSAMFRVNPSVDDANGRWSDFYSTAITREQIRPGSMVYDADGHVVVIYKVENDGRVRYFDTHPDNSVTHGVYGRKFALTSIAQGGGFKNFRPIFLVGAHTGSRGEYVGGSIHTISNSQIPGYSTEQYASGRHEGGHRRFFADGEWMGFQDFVRARLAAGNLKFHPTEELANGISAICSDFKDRVAAVQVATDAHFYLRSHPDRLPANIYGTSGDWENYSSPSRDARLKTSIVEILDHMKEMVDLYRQHSSRIDYQGSNIGADLRAAYRQAADACIVSYRRSNGAAQSLTYDDLIARLWKLSFDPYHCPEMRWGAESSEELATCREGYGDKMNWYKAEQHLRNQIDRKYNARMDFTVRELEMGGSGTGVATPPNVDLAGFLNGLSVE